MIWIRGISQGCVDSVEVGIGSDERSQSLYPEIGSRRQRRQWSIGDVVRSSRPASRSFRLPPASAHPAAPARPSQGRRGRPKNELADRLAFSGRWIQPA